MFGGAEIFPSGAQPRLPHPHCLHSKRKEDQFDPESGTSGFQCWEIVDPRIGKQLDSVSGTSWLWNRKYMQLTGRFEDLSQNQNITGRSSY